MSSLTSLLSRRPGSDQWRAVCLSAVGLLTSKSMLSASTDMLDSVVLVLIPHLFVDGSATGFCKELVKKIGQGQVTKCHLVLEALAQLSEEQGTLCAEGRVEQI